jgi:hypothetical protein
MQFNNQVSCKRCGQPMEMVANVAPIGASPGLVAFLCAECGTTKSDLVYRGEAQDLHQDRQATWN